MSSLYILEIKKWHKHLSVSEEVKSRNHRCGEYAKDNFKTLQLYSETRIKKINAYSVLTALIWFPHFHIFCQGEQSLCCSNIKKKPLVPSKGELKLNIYEIN